MKIVHYIIAIGMLAMIACTNTQPGNPPQYFANPEEAVKKATSDLLEVIKSQKEFNFGISPQELQKANIGPMIQNFDVKFSILLRADSSITFSKLVDKAKNKLFPLYIDNRIITLVELREEEKGWLIGGFSSLGIASELNTIIQSFQSSDKINISIYEVPNLKTNIYEVQINNQTLLFTNYKDMFSLKEPTRSERIIPILREDALRFQKEFGEKLKKEKLVD